VSYFAQLLAWASRGPGQVDQAEADFLAGLTGLPGVAIERRQADAKLQETLEHQALLTREMSHRFGVQSIKFCSWSILINKLRRELAD
jgi:GAF domain-containing protein